MNPLGPGIVYPLCLATSLLCAILLARAYRRTRSPMLFWSGLGFGFFALNNAIVVVDLMFLPQIDLQWVRQLASLAGIAVLLYGFIWEIE